MINFDNLPTSKPGAIIPAGKYIAVIEDAEMKAPKDLTKPDYLNLKLSLSNPDGTSVGIIWDILAESESPIVQYKLKRFVQALDLKLTNFALKDLQKIVRGKELIVDVCIQAAKDNRPEKSTIDIFKDDIFYSIKEKSLIFPDVINATDAEDSKSIKIEKEPETADTVESVEDDF